MSSSTLTAAPEVDRDSAEKSRRREYTTAFRRFAQGLEPRVRAAINGSGSPDWQSSRTFSLPVNADSPAYRMEDGDPVIETLNEIAELRGALPKIALWLADRVPGVGSVGSTHAIEQFRLAVSRICEAKNSRLEAHLISLAIGLNLRGNANGYAIAGHFGLTPQTIHEMLGETCDALGMTKPLAKANKARYSKTQHRHNIRRKP